MNEQNYGSLEACKRLEEAGIVLETEKAWYQRIFNPGEWFLRDKLDMTIHPDFIPAPSMAEVWRELPERQTISTCICEINFTKVGPLHLACYSWFYEAMSPVYKRTNPTDALIELRIWLGQRKEKP